MLQPLKAQLISRLGSLSQICQNNGLTATRANLELRSGKPATVGKEGTIAAETISSAVTSAFFTYSCIVQVSLRTPPDFGPHEFLRSSRICSRCRSGETNRFLFSALMAMRDIPSQRANKARLAQGFPSTPPLTKSVKVTRTMIAQLTGTPIQSMRFLNWKKSASRVYSPSTLCKTSGTMEPGASEG